MIAFVENFELKVSRAGEWRAVNIMREIFIVRLIAEHSPTDNREKILNEDIYSCNM